MDLAAAGRAEKAKEKEQQTAEGGAGGRKRQRVSVLAKLREPLLSQADKKKTAVKNRTGKEL